MPVFRQIIDRIPQDLKDRQAVFCRQWLKVVLFRRGPENFPKSSVDLFLGKGWQVLKGIGVNQVAAGIGKSPLPQVELTKRTPFFIAGPLGLEMPPVSGCS